MDAADRPAASVSHGEALDSPARPGDRSLNAAVDVDARPRLEDHPFTSLEPAYRRVRLLSAVGVTVLAIVGAGIAAIGTRSPAVFAIGLVVTALVAVGGALRCVEVDHMGYVVREHDLSFRSGLVTRSVATVPFARVQHVSIERGPIDRRYELATVKLSTAAVGVSIPGLRVTRAEQLKRLVAERAVELAENEIDDDPTTG